MIKSLFISLFGILNIAFSLSQTSPITFGAVSRTDLEMQPYRQEKGAGAVVLCDYASANVVYDDGFKVDVSRHVRIKIFKPSGYDYGNIRIDYTSKDKITEIEASTYNLVNDSVATTRVTKKQFIKEKTSLDEYAVRFAFPQVSEGSVIEYAYKMTQDEIRELIPFSFQKSIPVRHAEFWAVIPDWFTYSIDFRGNERIERVDTEKRGYIQNFATQLQIHVWTGNNLPALQPELYGPESGEYYPGVNFSLAAVSFPGNFYLEVAPSYPKLTVDLYRFSGIGRQLDNPVLFGKEVKEITGGKAGQLDKMRAIYDHVKDRVKWNGDERRLPYQPIRIAYREKTGNNADINCILINMLRTAGISADPVLLSTRENGKPNSFMALAGDLNYMVCLAEIEGKEYLLDATDKFRPMGMLPFNCLNGEGWVLNVDRGRWISLQGQEKKSVRELIDLEIADKGTLKGTFSLAFEGYSAIALRRLIHTQSIEGLEQELVDSTGTLSKTDIKIENLDNLDEPLTVTFTATAEHVLQSGGGLTFFEPLFMHPRFSWIKDNRTYPIDMGCPEYFSLVAVYHLPDSLQIDQMPEGIRLVLPGNEVSYTFGVNQNASLLTVTAELKIPKVWFSPEEYPDLREFYTRINKKISEMVVLK